MTKSNFQNSIFIITIICFLSTITIGFFLLWPKFQALETTKVSIAPKRQELQEKEKFFLKIEEDRKKIEKHQAQLSKIASALPDDAEISLSSLFRFLQVTSGQTGLILTEISSFAISPIEGKEIKKTQVSFQVMGSYASLKSFLERLEKSARIIIVENISFSAPEEEGGLFTFNIGIKVYSY